MTRLKSWTILAFALAFGALGCKGGGSSSSPAITLQISATTATVILTKTDLINSLVTGSTDTAVMWSLTCASGVAAGTCGTIVPLTTDPTIGVYTAPGTLPSTATVTIMAVAHASSSVSQTTTITIISGITLSISPNSPTLAIGTGETFPFTANVSNPACTTDATCIDVSWSFSSSCGTDCSFVTTPATATAPNIGTFHAPTAVPSPASVTITATSVKDTNATAKVTVTIVLADSTREVTLISVSPNTAALGSVFQDVYITGTNFLTTTRVFINGKELGDRSLITDVSSSILRVRIPDTFLALPPALPPALGMLAIGVSRQGGMAQPCATSSNCNIVVSAVRPAVVGPSPDSISQGNGVLNFNVNGGFFGTKDNPDVSATYDGPTGTGTRPAILPAATDPNATRQVAVTIGDATHPTDFGTPGLHQVAIHSAADDTKLAATNLAVQPNYSISAVSQIPPALPVGTTPSDVAINPATGIAVVANTGSNDVTLIDLTKPNNTGSAPMVIVASLCTGALGTTAGTTANPCPTPSGPMGVAVDYVRNIALVANKTSKNIAEVDLKTDAVVWVSPPLQDPPVAVGINPVTGRALVAINTVNAQTNYGVLIDLTGTTPTIASVVTLTTGPNSHVGVEPHLNWAISTPDRVGGALTIVELSAQTTNLIAPASGTPPGLSRANGTVTVNLSSASQPLLAVLAGSPVLIQNAADPSFDGVYPVATIGPGNTSFTYTQPNGSGLPNATSGNGTASYAEPVATRALTSTLQGIGINPETQEAVLLDPSVSSGVAFFSLLDLSSTPLPTQTGSSFSPMGNVAGAFNPLTNVAVVVNPSSTSNQLAVIDPSTPRVLTTFNTGKTPVAVAVDPGSNTAVVVNQGDNTVSIFSLSSSMGLPPGSSVHLPAITETSPKTFEAKSTLAGVLASSPQTLTIIGKGFTANSQVRLDGVQISVDPTKVSDRMLVATVPATMLNTARRFAVDVLENKSVSNVSDFTVVQSVDVTSASCAAPMPAGVAVDPQQGTGQGLAVVTLSGCNTVALIDLAKGTGVTPTPLVPVGSNPAGVAVLPRLGIAVVANNGSGNAILIDEVNQKVASGTNLTNPITTGTGPMGVGADQDTGEAAVANSVTNTVTVLNVTTGGVTSTILTGQRPIAVAFNYANHQIAVAQTGGSSNSVGIADASGTSVTTSFSASLPTSIVYDPVPGDCSASNTAGCFLANSSTGNLVSILDPTTNTQAAQAVFGVGINPTAIAYNYLTSTLVSTNTTSHTLTVVDLLGRRVRAVLSLPTPVNAAVAGQLALTGALQFGVDIDPLTNLAVIADTANGKVLFVPLPH